MTRSARTGDRWITNHLTREQCEALAKKVFALVPAGTQAQVAFGAGLGASTKFARGDIQLATETSGPFVGLTMESAERKSSVQGNRIDDEGLRQLVASADAAGREWRGTPEPPEMKGPREYKTPPKIFFEDNLPLLEPGGRGAVLSAALDAADAAGVIGAGTVSLSRNSHGTFNTEGLATYEAQTTTDFSFTARTKDGTGSGWAWGGYEDWSRVDTKAIVTRAIDLAQRSRRPVAIEPGRYTVILEPAAVAALIATINWDAWTADQGGSVFSKDPIGTNKIGLQMIDRRLNFVADPWDPEAPRTTINYDGDPLDRAQWMKDGVLVNLYYGTWYAGQKKRAPVMGPNNLRLYGEGPTQTLEEMIATTKRGVWVNRLSNITGMNSRTNLVTGTTRDGTFLIENGKITKAIKNFRFTESPFFVFNKLEAFGEPIRASNWSVAPRMKVRDFDFTSLTDAV